ncbi:MAG: hypothetical protein JWQ90_1501 [Hydrocarboniphaga sp.]|uniref:hypothetical protein n=1 Tax=Hydrocarboniphaga sp. TaxID=2033016 RepID=UPI00262F2E2A|nr:hypothetical protein [Hydrocarboniphaga sp.]MDB5969051.1 hypothetical protein [Hydrocarboniphaga sp.]
MDYSSFHRFAPIIQNLSSSELKGADSLFEKLLMKREGDLSISYVPFEFINKEARVVIVGITPGKTQMVNAVAEVRRQLDSGCSAEGALQAAKLTGAFSGAMRPNLIALLDKIGMNQHLGLRTCEQLFGTRSLLAQTTSALRNAVFLRNGNYNGTPNMVKTPVLKRELMSGFAVEARLLPEAVFVPLGGTVADALAYLVSEGVIKRHQVLDGLPHPAGANAERIAYFLGRKRRELLSVKTNPDKIDREKALVIAQVSSLGSLVHGGVIQ